MSNVKLTERIGKLLRQAENTDNENESAVFMEKAQALATANSIDLAKARHSQTVKERTVPIVRQVVLGKRGTRGLNTYVDLIGGIARNNDVKFNIAHNRTYVNLFGFEEDIDMVEALYASLLLQMISASQAYKKTGAWKSDTVWKPSSYRYTYTFTDGTTASAAAYKRYENSWYGQNVREVTQHGEYVPGSYVPVPWLSARLDFQQAFAERVEVRLYEARMKAEAEAKLADDLQTAGTELVLREKTLAVRDFYNAKSNARGSYRGGRKGITSWAAHSAGDNAGRSARLGNQSEVGGARKAIA